MKYMNTKKALDIKKAIITLSEYLDIPFQQVASNICFLDDIKYQKLKKASDIWNKFDNADIQEKGKMLGVEIKFNN